MAYCQIVFEWSSGSYVVIVPGLSLRKFIQQITYAVVYSHPYKSQVKPKTKLQVLTEI